MPCIHERRASMGHRQSANWTCVGILAHESALAGGKIIKLPDFTRMSKK